MQIKRLLDDRDVFAGSKVFDAQGRSYAFVGHSGGKLVVKSDDERPIRFSLLIWVAMWFTPTGPNEGWLKSGFVIIGQGKGL